MSGKQGNNSSSQCQQFSKKRLLMHSQYKFMRHENNISHIQIVQCKFNPVRYMKTWGKKKNQVMIPEIERGLHSPSCVLFIASRPHVVGR